MISVGFAVIAVLCLAGGFGAGWAAKAQHVKSAVLEAQRVERARLQGRIDYLEGKTSTPGLEPPKDIFGRPI